MSLPTYKIKKIKATDNNTYEIIPERLQNSGYEAALPTLTENVTLATSSDLSNKMDKANPTGTGYFSLNRASGSTVGTNSVAIGTNTIASGNYSFAEGYGTRATGSYSHAEGYGYLSNSSFTLTGSANSTTYTVTGTPPVVGVNIIYNNIQAKVSAVSGNTITVTKTLSSSAVSGIKVEIVNGTANGSYSHIEGYGAIANDYAHAEGFSTVAGMASHAEGYRTTATGSHAHSEGNNTSASGLDSHTEGQYTIANHKSQHVFGEYNIADQNAAASTSRGNYVEMVGNGDSTTRSNARTLDWNGNEWLAGGLTIGSNATISDGTNSVAISDIAKTSQLPDMTNVAYKNINNNFTTNQKFGGSLEINSDGSSWSEGIRIHPASNQWSGIVLCEASNSGGTGTSANTWSMHNNEGAFGFYKNGSNASASQYFRNESNAWAMKGNLTVNNNINAIGTVKVGNTVTLQYNSTTEALDFVF